MTAVDLGPADFDYVIGRNSCLELLEGLSDQNGDRIELAGFASTLSITWRGGSLTLSTGNARLSITQDDGGDDVLSGEITASEIASMPLGRMTEYEWWVTPAGGCPFKFKQGYLEIV